MKSCPLTQEYLPPVFYQGEDIPITLVANNLDTELWTVYIYCFTDKIISYTQDQAIKNESNQYTLTIDSETSANLPAGKYNIEVFFNKTNKIIIQIQNAFEINASVVKQFINDGNSDNNN